MHTFPSLSRIAKPARWLACCLAACLVAACAAAPERDAERASGPGEPAVTGEEGAPGIEARQEPTNDEVMYRVFAAEYLGAEGDLPAAVGEYLEAAMLSDDPEIARRATRVAFAAEAWQQAAMAADRWAVLECHAAEGRQGLHEPGAGRARAASGQGTGKTIAAVSENGRRCCSPSRK